MKQLYIFHPFLNLYSLARGNWLASVNFYLQWLLSQVNSKLTTLFTCSGSVFWLLQSRKDFVFCFGSEKQRMVGSGFPTCSNVVSLLLQTVCIFGLHSPLHALIWATCKDLCWKQSLQITEVVATSHCYCSSCIWMISVQFCSMVLEYLWYFIALWIWLYSSGVFSSREWSKYQFEASLYYWKCVHIGVGCNGYSINNFLIFFFFCKQIFTL